MQQRDILKEILAYKIQEVEYRKKQCSLDEIKARAEQAETTRGFNAAIQSRISAGKLAVIAEIKKASPSKGIIREHFVPEEIAKSYAQADATCLSILTDVKYFQGADAYLKIARSVTRLPVLRKDFIVDPYQIYESRAIGADCILLIVAGLTDIQLQQYSQLARQLTMDVLVEVHNREELERGLMLRTPLIGINNRDLRTFKTSLNTTLDLLVDVFPDRTVVTESGIHTPEDVALMRRHGVSTFLVGEAFMSANDPGEKLTALFGN